MSFDDALSKLQLDNYPSEGFYLSNKVSGSNADADISQYYLAS